jgi:hypothetical protein
MTNGHQSLLLALACVLVLGACLYVALTFITHILLVVDQVIAFLFGLTLIN